jgi:MFS family permease
MLPRPPRSPILPPDPGVPASEGARPAVEASTRTLLVLILGQIGLHATMAGLRMAAPLQLLREGWSAWWVGLLMALFAAAPVLLALPAGRMADRYGYHRPVRLSVALGMLGMVLALASTRLQGAAHFALLALAAMLNGTAANVGAIAIQRAAGVMARDSVHRVRLFSWLGVAPPLSNVVGPVAVGFMIDGGGFSATYAMLLAFPLLSLVAASRVPDLQPRVAPDAARGTAWELLQVPGIPRLFVINLVMATCWDVHAFAVPILGHERGFTATMIGIILGTFTLSVSVVRGVLPMVVHRLVEAQVIRVAMVGTCAVFAVYPLATSPALMLLCAATLGVTLGVVQPMIMSTLHHLTPERRHGEALALRSMAMNVASTVMPLVFGASGSIVGAGVLFWLVSALVGTSSWLTLALRRREPG